MNGNHMRIKKYLDERSSEEKEHIRNLTTFGEKSWTVNFNKLNIIDQNLLYLGILKPVNDPSKDNSIVFTSTVIFCACFNVLWPQPMNYLLKADLHDPIDLLKYSLQHISPI